MGSNVRKTPRQLEEDLNIDELPYSHLPPIKRPRLSTKFHNCSSHHDVPSARLDESRNARRNIVDTSRMSRNFELPINNDDSASPNNLESQSQQRKIVSPKSTGPEILPMVQETKLKSLIESAEAERRDLLAEVKEHRIKAREEPFSAQRKETATEKTTQMFFSLKETLSILDRIRSSLALG